MAADELTPSLAGLRLGAPTGYPIRDANGQPKPVLSIEPNFWGMFRRLINAGFVRIVCTPYPNSVCELRFHMQCIGSLRDRYFDPSVAHLTRPQFDHIKQLIQQPPLGFRMGDDRVWRRPFNHWSDEDRDLQRWLKTEADAWGRSFGPNGVRPQEREAAERRAMQMRMQNAVANQAAEQRAARERDERAARERDERATRLVNGPADPSADDKAWYMATFHVDLDAARAEARAKLRLQEERKELNERLARPPVRSEARGLPLKYPQMEPMRAFILKTLEELKDRIVRAYAARGWDLLRYARKGYKFMSTTELEIIEDLRVELRATTTPSRAKRAHDAEAAITWSLNFPEGTARDAINRALKEEARYVAEGNAQVQVRSNNTLVVALNALWESLDAARRDAVRRADGRRTRTPFQDGDFTRDDGSSSSSEEEEESEEEEDDRSSYYTDPDHWRRRRKARRVVLSDDED